MPLIKSAASCTTNAWSMPFSLGMLVYVVSLCRPALRSSFGLARYQIKLSPLINIPIQNMKISPKRRFTQRRNPQWRVCVGTETDDRVHTVGHPCRRASSPDLIENKERPSNRQADKAGRSYGLLSHPVWVDHRPLLSHETSV